MSVPSGTPWIPPISRSDKSDFIEATEFAHPGRVGVAESMNSPNAAGLGVAPSRSVGEQDTKAQVRLAWRAPAGI